MQTDYLRALRGRIKLPIRVTITTVFAMFTAISISLVASLSFFSGRDIILESARDDIAKAAETAQKTIDELVGQASLTTETIAGMAPGMFEWSSPEALLNALTVGLRNNSDIYGVFVGFHDGAFIQAINLTSADGTHRKVAGMPDEAAMAWRVIGPVPASGVRTARWRYFDRTGAELIGANLVSTEPSDYDPRTRPWFKKAQTEQKTAISDVYVFASLKRPGMTISRPVRAVPSAVVGVDLSLNDLAGLARRLQPGANGVFAVIDDKSRMVAHSAKAELFKPNTAGNGVELITLGEMNDPKLAMAVNVGNTANASGFTFKSNGKEYLGFERFPPKDGLVHWTLVSIAAVDDYIGGLMTALYSSLGLAVVIVIGSVFVVAVMGGWISRPVVRLRHVADQITALNLSRIDTFDSPFDEIKELQTSM
jgi:adenylate cyclase